MLTLSLSNLFEHLGKIFQRSPLVLLKAPVYRNLAIDHKAYP